MRVLSIDAKAHAALLRDRHVLHVKGFGPSLGWLQPPPSLIAFLASADVLAFDGDDAAEDSFVRALLRARAGTPDGPRLLAYKLSHELDRFRASWSAASIDASGDDAATVHVLAVPSADLAPPHYAGAADACPAPQRVFVALGVRALELTRGAAPQSLAVAAWGGHHVVRAEFLQNEARFGLADMPRWRYWHCARTREGALQPGQLLGVAHPALQHEIFEP
jgi:hypothetical protein